MTKTALRIDKKALKAADTKNRRQVETTPDSIHALCCARFFTIDFGGKFYARILVDGEKVGLYDISDGVGLLIGYIQHRNKHSIKVFVRRHLMDWTSVIKFNQIRIAGALQKGPYQIP